MSQIRRELIHARHHYNDKPVRNSYALRYSVPYFEQRGRFYHDHLVKIIVEGREIDGRRVTAKSTPLEFLDDTFDPIWTRKPRSNEQITNSETHVSCRCQVVSEDEADVSSVVGRTEGRMRQHQRLGLIIFLVAWFIHFSELLAKKDIMPTWSIILFIIAGGLLFGLRVNSD